MTASRFLTEWQGAGTSSVRELAPELPFDVARRGYAVGSAVLAAVLPAGDIVTQLAQALDVIRRHDPARIVTLGGECAVSVAPFAELAHRYGDDLAVICTSGRARLGPATRPS